jgi:hypothetical protein
MGGYWLGEGNGWPKEWLSEGDGWLGEGNVWLKSEMGGFVMEMGG